MKQLSVSETARRFHEVIHEVEADGQEFLVFRKALPVARIVPEPAPRTALEVTGDLYGTLDEKTGAAWVAAMQLQKKKQRKANRGLLTELRNPWVS